MMTKNELIAEIINYKVKQGIKCADAFVHYVTIILPMLSIDDLEAILCLLEEKAHAQWAAEVEFEDVPY